MEVYNPIEITKIDNTEINKLNISLKLNKILEEMISKDPGQWIWTHNRWK
jgi:KDO2-lipid IV(A) lauroyltransferase